MTRCAPPIAALLVVSLGAAGCGNDDTRARHDAAWQATLDDVRARATELGIPGVGIAIVLDGRLAYSGGVGVRSRTDGGAVTGETLFRSSSAATKPVIALALLDMAEEGLVDLHAPIGELVPGMQVDPAHASEIDLDLLLLQRSGLGPVDYRRLCTPDDASVLRYFAQAGTFTSSAPPGAVWEYTALGSVAGAAAIETIEGRPFIQVLRDRVLTPAGTTTATYDVDEAASREHALGHDGGAELEPNLDPGYRCGERIASTGLYASAADHGRLLELLLSPGRVLEAASLEALEGATHNPGFGASWSYGYQAYGLAYRGVRVFHHYGSSEGFTSGMSWIPERGFGVVILANAGAGDAYRNIYAVEEMRWRIIDRFLGLQGPFPDETTPPSTWSRYAGTFVDPTDPGTSFVFARDAELRLTGAVLPGAPTPVVLSQGAADAPYEGGDVFSYSAGASYLIVGFFPSASGGFDYANVYSSAVGHHFAVRTP